MQTFVVLLHTPPLNENAASTAVADKLKGADFDVYSFADNVIIARAEKALTKDVVEAAGLSSAGGVPGIVFKLNRAYAGFTEAPLWEWLDMHAGVGGA